MITTFITVLAVLTLVGQVGLLALYVAAFMSLPPYQQQKVTFTVSTGFLVVFLAATAWLISLAFS
jgi:hypothetical protein